jgi:hypothetical protein
MTLEAYLQQQIEQLAAKIAAEAPVDSCPHCDVCEGRLIYADHVFQYECTLCGLRWSTEQLMVDGNGKFLMLEWAD